MNKYKEFETEFGAVPTSMGKVGNFLVIEFSMEEFSKFKNHRISWELRYTHFDGETFVFFNSSEILNLVSFFPVDGLFTKYLITEFAESEIMDPILGKLNQNELIFLYMVLHNNECFKTQLENYIQKPLKNGDVEW